MSLTVIPIPPDSEDFLERDSRGRLTGKVKWTWRAYLDSLHSSANGPKESPTGAFMAGASLASEALDAAMMNRALYSRQEREGVGLPRIPQRIPEFEPQTQFIRRREWSITKLIPDTEANITLYDPSAYPESLFISTDTFNVYYSGAGAAWTLIGTVNDTAYGSSWNGVTTIAPSKNAVYDKIESLNIVSGVYTPTLANTTNISASTAYQCQYVRVGSVVMVSGRVAVDPTAAGSAVLTISLPIASNFGAAEDCAGVAAANSVAGQSAAIYGDSTNDAALMAWIAVDVTNQDMFFTFTYRVI